jgi:murein DD-endopeptidase MepM/ murein hydrolase activator NlpD
MADNGYTQLNDIALNIPPESIQVNRRSFNHEWQTLRTRSSVKVKSGFSQLDVTMTVKFTDDPIAAKAGTIFNGFRKLRALVSQFRVTPFCYVENQFLRNSILGGAAGQNMALALKQMEISKTDDTTNVITVTFNFAWFNYFPYSKAFTFKRDIFVGDEVQDPSLSDAWRLLYEAEQRRTNYRVVDKLTTFTRLTYNEFNSIHVQDYSRLKKEVETLDKLRNQLLKIGPNDTGATGDLVQKTVANELKDAAWTESLLRDVFGDQTSMNGSNDIDGPTEKDVKKEVLRVINNNLKSSDEVVSRYDIIVNSEWKPVVLNDSKVVKFSNEPTATTDQDKFDKSSTVLMKRSRSLPFEDNGLITSGITISFENILATLPMIGHPFPTFQHIGSIDARIVISLITTSEQSVQKLSALYNSVEDQARKYRQVPSGQRNILIENDLVNMCGIKDTIPDSMVIETVPGLPGTYSAVLVLVNNPLDADTSEKFVTEGSFTSGGDLRLKLAEILERNIKLIDNPFTTDAKGRIDLRSLKSPELLIGTSALPDPETGRRMVEVTGVKEPGESGYYQYSGSKDQKKALFRSLCSDYARELSQLLSDVFPIIKKWKENPSTLTPVEDFFVLKNIDVFGIERIQTDISNAIQSTKLSDGSAAWMKKHEGAPGLQHMFEQQKKTETFFKVMNELRDARSTVVLTPNAQETIISEKTEAVDAFRNDERLTALINTYFSKWLTFSNAFLDKILYSGIIALPEFEEVRELLNNKAIQASGGAYPDFPLEDVVGLLQTAKGSNLQHSFRRLKELFQNSGLALKNVGMSVLINPDFFFFNPQNDVQETIIPPTVMRTAANSIIEARREMEPAERDWFTGVYRSNILGNDKFDKTAKILAERQGSDEYKAFLKTDAGQHYNSSLDKSFKLLAVAPNTLTGSVGPSISESVRLPAVQKEGEETTGSNSISIRASNTGNDTHNTRSNYNVDTSLLPNQDAYAVRHRFETDDVLSELPEAQYIPNDGDPNKVPIISWPTPSTCRRITSKHGPRVQPVAGASTNHPGCDISLNVKPKGSGIDACAGTPIYAVADGIISSAKYLPNFGVILSVKHAGNCVTRYVHLGLDDLAQYWIDLMNRTGQFKDIDPVTRENKLSVRQLQQIGVVGPTAPVSTAAHLHFEMYIGGQNIDPLPYLTGDAYKSRGPLKGIDPSNDSVLSKSVQQFSKDLHKGQGYSMMRAFPTFKLYFIESDAGERKRFAFDDFFAYSSVKEIQVIRSRKIAADLCVIQLTNISGVLSNRKFSSSLDPTKVKDATGQSSSEKPKTAGRTNTADENPIASLMLQPGIQIQLRLGYSNNPEELDIVFNGLITDVEFTETDDLVQIVCQSYATELVQSIQGEVKDFGGFFDGGGRTFKILEELMASPEVVHFGRWEQGNVGVNNNRGLLTQRWRLIPTPQDDNIFAPLGQTSLGIIDAIISTTKYLMYQTTIWDVFQEMCLRHPSYIAAAVPYEGKYGPRMTMFYGLPDQLYFARDSSFKEDNVVESLKNVVKSGHQDDASAAALDDIRDNNFELDAEKLQDFLDEDLYKKTASERDRWFQLLSKQYALDKGYIRPFRNYHLFTSSLHILHNSLSSSAHNTFNTVTLQYGSSSPKFEEDTAEVNFDNLETFTLRADEAIPDEETREMFAQFPNCVGYEMAKQYSVSLLFNSLKEAYKGSLVVIGSPKVKPYDVCYIFDEYTDMFGPVEVEQVIHKFTQQTGFITEITPDLMVHVNQHSTLSTSDAMGLIAEHSIRSIGIPSLPSIASNSVMTGMAAATLAGSPMIGMGIGAAYLGNLAFSPIASMIFNSSENSLGQSGSSSAFGLVGGFIFRKLITRTQLAHPFRFSPLVLNGRPMIGGLPNRRSDGTFIQKMGKWFKDSNEGIGLMLDDTLDRMSPNNWLGQLGEGDIKSLIPGS